MEKIIITINKPAFNMEAIGRLLAVANEKKFASQEIYLKCMRGAIAVCLS